MQKKEEFLVINGLFSFFLFMHERIALVWKHFSSVFIFLLTWRLEEMSELTFAAVTDSSFTSFVLAIPNSSASLYEKKSFSLCVVSIKKIKKGVFAHVFSLSSDYFSFKISEP